MRNYKKMGDTLTLTAPYDVASGAGFLVGAIFAVAVIAALAGQKVEGQRVGVVELPKAAGAVTQGQKLYWDDAAKLVTTTAGANKLIGAAALAAAGGDATVQVVLMPTAA
jgi:predicted RecA/RadA family phage recombinase